MGETVTGDEQSPVIVTKVTIKFSDGQTTHFKGVSAQRWWTRFLMGQHILGAFEEKQKTDAEEAASSEKQEEEESAPPLPDANLTTEAISNMLKKAIRSR